MFPYLLLGKVPLPTYGLMILLGATAAWVYFHRRLKARGENPGQAEQAFWFGALGAILGAKVLYLLPRLPQLVADLALLPDQRDLFAALTTDLVPAVPLFHTFGRVGCFLAGCCYGIPAPEGCPGVVFPQGSAAPGGTALVPVQLYESAGCLLLFLLLDRLARRGRQGDALLAVYLCLYALLRFCLEFLRGDAARGFVGPLSTSQAVALLTLAVVLGTLAWRRRTS